jgi:hypothetical protein
MFFNEMSAGRNCNLYDIYQSCINMSSLVFLGCSVSFIVSVVLCAVCCLSVVCYFV